MNPYLEQFILDDIQMAGGLKLQNLARNFPDKIRVPEKWIPRTRLDFLIAHHLYCAIKSREA